jgi:hypothetical protein
MGWHDNCSHNLNTTTEKDLSSLKLPGGWVPNPLNLFMIVSIDHRGQLDIKPPVSEKGECIVMLAEVHVVVIMSACPQDVAPVKAREPTDCAFEIFNPKIPLQTVAYTISEAAYPPSLPQAISKDPGRRIQITLSFDFDAVSHWLGTGYHPDNKRKKYFPNVFMLPQSLVVNVQEVTVRLCTRFAKPLSTSCGNKNLLYDTSLMHHNSQLYFTPNDPPVKVIDFSKPAASWLHPTSISPFRHFAIPWANIHWLNFPADGIMRT